jgi:hypothetical protein
MKQEPIETKAEPLPDVRVVDEAAQEEQEMKLALLEAAADLIEETRPPRRQRKTRSRPGRRGRRQRRRRRHPRERRTLQRRI